MGVPGFIPTCSRSSIIVKIAATIASQPPSFSSPPSSRSLQSPPSTSVSPPSPYFVVARRHPNTSLGARNPQRRARKPKPPHSKVHCRALSPSSTLERASDGSSSLFNPPRPGERQDTQDRFCGGGRRSIRYRSLKVSSGLKLRPRALASGRAASSRAAAGAVSGALAPPHERRHRLVRRCRPASSRVYAHRRAPLQARGFGTLPVATQPLRAARASEQWGVVDDVAVAAEEQQPVVNRLQACVRGGRSGQEGMCGERVGGGGYLCVAGGGGYLCVA